MNEKTELPLKKLESSFLELGCYKKTAIARNFTLQCMEDGDIRAVVYRYFDNMQLEERRNFDAFMKLISTLSCSLFLTVYTYSSRKDLLTTKNLTEMDDFREQLFLLVYFCSFAIACFGIACGALEKYNAKLFAETQKTCGKWINENIAPNFARKLKKIDYCSRDGFFTVNQLLDKKHIAQAKKVNIMLEL